MHSNYYLTWGHSWKVEVHQKEEEEGLKNSLCWSIRACIRLPTASAFHQRHTHFTSRCVLSKPHKLFLLFVLPRSSCSRTFPLMAFVSAAHFKGGFSARKVLHIEGSLETTLVFDWQPKIRFPDNIKYSLSFQWWWLKSFFSKVLNFVLGMQKFSRKLFNNEIWFFLSSRAWRENYNKEKSSSFNIIEEKKKYLSKYLNMGFYLLSFSHHQTY